MSDYFTLENKSLNLEGIMLREKSCRERQILYDFTYMWIYIYSFIVKVTKKKDSQILRTD